MVCCWIISSSPIGGGPGGSGPRYAIAPALPVAHLVNGHGVALVWCVPQRIVCIALRARDQHPKQVMSRIDVVTHKPHAATLAPFGWMPTVARCPEAVPTERCVLIRPGHHSPPSVNARCCVATSRLAVSITPGSIRSVYCSRLVYVSYAWM